MSRNFGWGSRDMADAVRLELKRRAGTKKDSFSTASTLAERFVHFARFAKRKGVGRLERVTSSLVIEYGQGLSKRVKRDDMDSSYAQNLVSAVNSVMKMNHCSTWHSISPVKDCGIPKRCHIRKEPTFTIEQGREAIERLKSQGLDKLASVAELALLYGLRSKEASLLDFKAVLSSNASNEANEFELNKGTKGGRKRKVRFGQDVEALKRAADLQAEGNAMIPLDKNWKMWRESDLKKGREELHKLNIKGFHEFRAAYAALRYEELVGWKAACNGGNIKDKDADRMAREILAKELGHGRIDVVSEYIGGLK